ncbi:MAG TPA: recombinase family protein [Candidatus Saccharibacteria bacterium]|nr:recombinase family protein [Candidatus Saccharibacteria bacterium]
MPRQLEPIDLTKLRYVLYARKSTEDEGSQMRSIDDQIADCQRLAEREGLNVVDVEVEARSAKRPGNRPTFTKLLENIGKKYDAILCWHPDRLSRNMLESGRIIDMLDNHVIKDLRFVSHQFSNDANGKMLLGMLFVFSKQYSEDLSEKVLRGTQGNFEEGKSSGTPKWGYVRDDITGYYERDGNYEHIRRGWEMRSEGARISEVISYWKSNNVHRMTKVNRKNKRAKKVQPSQNSATKLFRDPFYYGILVQAGQEVDLRELYGFEPMIDEKTYGIVQELSYSRSKLKPLENKQKVFYPLRGLVYCGVCNDDKPMRVGKNKSGSGKHFLTYRCDNSNCTRKIKSVRAHYIFDNLYESLEKLKFTEKEYLRYSKQIDTYTDDRMSALRTEYKSLQGTRDAKQHKLDETARQLPTISKKSPAYGVLERDLERMQDELVNLEEQMGRVKAKIADPAKVRMTKEEFLNLANSAADKMRAGIPVEKDMLARKMLLNLTINDEMVPSYHWKEPFATLLESKKINFGADERT